MSGKIEVTRKPNLYHTREINAIYGLFGKLPMGQKSDFLDFFKREIIARITDEKALDFISQIYELLSEKAS